MHLKNFKTFFEIINLNNEFTCKQKENGYFVAFYKHRQFEVVGSGETKELAKENCSKGVVDYLKDMVEYKNDFKSYLDDQYSLCQSDDLKLSFCETATKLGLKCHFEDYSLNDNQASSIVYVDGLNFKAKSSTDVEAQKKALILAFAALRTIYGESSNFYQLAKYKFFDDNAIFSAILNNICTQNNWSINYDYVYDENTKNFQSSCSINKNKTSIETAPYVSDILGTGQRKQISKEMCAKKICLIHFKNEFPQHLICQIINILTDFVSRNFPEKKITFRNTAEISKMPPFFESICETGSYKTSGFGSTKKDAKNLSAIKMLIKLRTLLL